MVKIREVDNKKEYEDVINTHYIMGYKIEKQNNTETTFKKTKTSKIILHIIIIIISWIIGYAILSNILYLGYLIGFYKTNGYILYLTISLISILIILIIANYKPISKAHNGEKITIKLKN